MACSAFYADNYLQDARTQFVYGSRQFGCLHGDDVVQPHLWMHRIRAACSQFSLFDAGYDVVEDDAVDTCDVCEDIVVYLFHIGIVDVDLACHNH